MNIDILSKYVTTAAAFIGMGFGLYNFLVARSSRKVKLKIIPQSIMLQRNDIQTGKEVIISAIDEFNEVTGEFLIDVINMSSFPVTVTHVGFKLKVKPGNLIIVKPIIKDNGTWPRKLEHRESVSLYFPLSNLLNSHLSISIKNAFAKTTCGTTCTGTSVALKKLVKFIKEERKISQHQ